MYGVILDRVVDGLDFEPANVVAVWCRVSRKDGSESFTGWVRRDILDSARKLDSTIDVTPVDVTESKAFTLEQGLDVAVTSDLPQWAQ